MKKFLAPIVLVVSIALILPIAAFTQSNSVPSQFYDNRLLRNTLRSVVQVHSVDYELGATAACTGFVVDAARGWVLTAEHCIIGNGKEVYVNLVPSELVKKSDWLALLKVPPMSFPPLDIAKKAPPLFEEVIGIGWAWGKLLQALPRQVSGFEGTDVIVNGAMIGGMSGGPVINMKGKVIGLIQAGNAAASILSGPEEIREFLGMK